ncbi:MAG: four helix bundle protein [Deltaproteobacteria bacterium]|jgi:four helix bundle protein|nr:four helix bundle protein [Deltaproteobacteria bacterium]
MKRVYELDVYKLAEALSDIVWHDFDKWNKKVQNTVGYQIIRSSDSIAANIKAIIKKLGPKLNTFINSIKA